MESNSLAVMKVDIYYIEDDHHIAQLVQEYLKQQNYRVTIFSSLAHAKQRFETHIPSVVLLDWNMPDGKGSELCQWIRKRWSKLPIIFLTVQGDSQDIVTGFEIGADDYVVKPFELEVLHSRMKALLRRSQDISGRYLSCGSISIDKSRMAVMYQETEISLSHAEYQLLLILMENQGKTVTRQQLLEQIWDSNGNFVNDNTLTVAMKRLREKLHHPSCLKTIRSFGYRLENGL